MCWMRGATEQPIHVEQKKVPMNFLSARDWSNIPAGAGLLIFVAPLAAAVISVDLDSLSFCRLDLQT